MIIRGDFKVDGVLFAHWFNISFEVNNKKLFPHYLNEDNFNKLMNVLHDFTAQEEISLEEFVGHFCIVYNETGGTFKPIREMGTARYMFGTNDGKKLSYNRSPNRLAGDQLKEWGVISSQSDVALWNGQFFPIGAPNEIIVASFKCDYYRFRGWGFNQLTWHSNYLAHLQPLLPKSIDSYGYEEFENLLKGNYELACKTYYSYAKTSPNAISAMRSGNYVPYGKLITGGWMQYVNNTYVPRCKALYEALMHSKLVCENVGVLA